MTIIIEQIVQADITEEIDYHLEIDENMIEITDRYREYSNERPNNNHSYKNNL